MTAPRRRLAISALGEGGLDDPVSPHFGRCAAFAVVELEGDELAVHQAIANPFATHHGPGDVPTFLAGLGATDVLAGGMGGRAIALFAEHGIRTSVGHVGTVREAVESWRRMGPLDGAPCAGHGHEHHHGEGGCGRHGG